MPAATRLPTSTTSITVLCLLSSLRLGIWGGTGFVPFCRQQAPPQRPSQFGQQQDRIFVDSLAALAHEACPNAAMGCEQTPTIPRLTMSDQMRLERRMEFARCMVFLVYDSCAAMFAESYAESGLFGQPGLKIFPSAAARRPGLNHCAAAACGRRQAGKAPWLAIPASRSRYGSGELGSPAAIA